VLDLRAADTPYRRRELIEEIRELAVALRAGASCTCRPTESLAEECSEILYTLVR